MNQEEQKLRLDFKVKTTMLKSGLCDYSDAYMLVKETITVNNTVAADADANNVNNLQIINIYKLCIIC